MVQLRRTCPHCGKSSVSKDLYGNGDYCFPSQGGCGKKLSYLSITDPGLARGYAIEPYSFYLPDSEEYQRSSFGDDINMLKYHSLNAAKKREIIKRVSSDKSLVCAVDDLIGSAISPVIVPAPSSKNREVQHVHEIAKSLAAKKYIYCEALRKMTSTESKSMDRGADYSTGDFICTYDLKGYSALIFDDTYGEGATLRAMIQELKRYGATDVYFLSMCKNTRGGIKQSSSGVTYYYNNNNDSPF